MYLVFRVVLPLSHNRLKEFHLSDAMGKGGLARLDLAGLGDHIHMNIPEMLYIILYFKRMDLK